MLIFQTHLQLRFNLFYLVLTGLPLRQLYPLVDMLVLQYLILPFYRLHMKLKIFPFPFGPLFVCLFFIGNPKSYTGIVSI